MNNYTIRQESATPAGNAVIQASVIGLILLAQIAPLDVQKSRGQNIALSRHQQVRIKENPKTYGQYANLFTGEYEHSRSQQDRRISLREARKIALQILADTERSLQEERLAEARFIASLWDNEDWGV